MKFSEIILSQSLKINNAYLNQMLPKIYIVIFSLSLKVYCLLFKNLF